MPDAPTDVHPRLTTRELQVIELIAQGLSHQEVGERLCITTGTVGRHLSNACMRIGAVNTIVLVLRVYSINAQKLLT